MKFILGKKVGMTQRFKEDGKVVPVTVVTSGPCVVTQIKSQEKDGYQAVQVGYSNKKKAGKSLKGHLKGLETFQYLKEFLIEEIGDLKRGNVIKVNVFQPGDMVNVIGTSKGKGFQGVIKRHGFKGGPGSHGDKDQHRAPGSIGATDAARVFKGMKMAGQMGTDRVTVRNLEIVEIDPDNNLLYIKGAVPGAPGSLLMISGQGEIKIKDDHRQSEKKDTAPDAKSVNASTKQIDAKKK